MKLIIYLILFFFIISGYGQTRLKALIVDGQNNHAVWPKLSIMMKQYLEDTNLFEVHIYRTLYT